MTKVNLNDLASLANPTTAITTINGNNTTIEQAFDNTLSRNGSTPNQMGANIDMNSHRIINLPVATLDTEPVRLDQVTDLLGTLINGGDVPLPTGGETGYVLTATGANAYDWQVLETADLVINDGDITTAKLATNAVTTVKITDANVTTAKIADANVTTVKIADSNVTTAKIAAGAVTTAKIAAGAVTATELGSGAVTVGKLSTTGTPSSTTVLFGDMSWGTVSSVAIAGQYKNLQITNGGTPNTQVSLTADAVIATNGSSYAASGALSLTISTGTTGANALDTGTVANSTWYSVWAIYNSGSNTWAGLLSTSATAPTMPSGYTYKVRLGWVRTNGSANLLRLLQKGNRVQYRVVAASTTPNLPIIQSGATGNVATPTWTSLSVSSYVPSTASIIHVVASGGVSSGTFILAPNSDYGGYASTTNPPISMITATGGGTLATSMMLESTNIYFACGAGYLACSGWEDNI